METIMSLSDIINRTFEYRPGVAGAWRTEILSDDDTAAIAELYHYNTMMLRWRISTPADSAYLDWSLGWGRVSDQQGMNQAFSILGLPYYYSRRGGAQILSLHYSDDVRQLPKYVRDWPVGHLGATRGNIVQATLNHR